MNRFIAVLYLLTAVSAYATTLVLNKDTGKDYRVAMYSYFTYPPSAGFGETVVRMAFLYPKLGSKVTGLSTSGLLEPTPLSFLKFEENEVLNHLIAFSDCKNWYGVFAEFFSPTVGTYHKVYGHDTELRYLNLESLASFLHDKLTREYYEGLVKSGLPSHPLVHRLGMYYR